MLNPSYNDQKELCLIGALSILNTKMQNATDRLYKEIMRLDHFVQTYLRIDASLEQIRQMTHIGRHTYSKSVDAIKYAFFRTFDPRFNFTKRIKKTFN